MIAAVSAGGSSLATPGILATPAAVHDFLIQNVCLDARGAVLIGVSPADGNPACVEQRDLRPGVRLPYHKHDHPNQGDGTLLGYQRHDSFPVETAGFGEVVEHSFDFGAGTGEGRRFAYSIRAATAGIS